MGENCAQMSPVTASQVAEFSFCSRAYGLRCEGHRPRSERLGGGLDYHRAHGKKVVAAEAFGRAGRALILVAGLLALVLVALALAGLGGGR